MMRMMKSGLILLLSLVGLAAERLLVWEDTFSDDVLDEGVWTVQQGNGCDQGDGMCGWGNHEQQTYTLDNHRVENGMLSITAERLEEQLDERWYSSSRLRSKAPVAYLTGRIEARIQVPAGQGLWAAFWMLPSNSSRGHWAATGEIDIMELTNDMESILGTIHYGGEYPANRYAGCKSGQLGSGLDYSDDFHVYAIEWEQEEMRWYVDDQLFCQRTKWVSDVESFDPYRAPFDTEFELLLNLAVGGTLPGRIVDDTVFPATMLVDYVRVYDISTDVPSVAEPFLGLPVCLPGTVQAEAFDTGGLGLGFGETQPEGVSGTYRIDGVGLVDSNSGVTYVANLTDTDWLAYTVVTEASVYDITLQVSTTEAADLELIVGDDVTCAEPGDGSITGIVVVEGTRGEDGEEWGEVVVSEVEMPAGTLSLKLCVRGGVGIGVDRITFGLVSGASASEECATSGQSRPYMGVPWTIPGYMEAEYYDYGGLGVSYHKLIDGRMEGNFSTLRQPDAVGVLEAESNPSHGHYVGYWEAGEWLAFTARAEESGFWYVGASIASGLNGTTIEFRILVNATNCSTASTDGFDGLGDEGVDLLNGPLLGGYTGSWEAFETVAREEVYVPQGTHRFLFCSDAGVFNVNYLRVWTPRPTLAPTMAPTLAPTPAPMAPGDGGFDTKWIYIGVGTAVVFLALSRLGCIVYSKERSRRRRKPDEPDDGLEPAYLGSDKDFSVATTDQDKDFPRGWDNGSGNGNGTGTGTGTPPSDDTDSGFGQGQGQEGLSSEQGNGRLSNGADMGGSAVAVTRGMNGGAGAAVAPGDGLDAAKAAAAAPALLQQESYRGLFGPRRELSTSRGISSSFQEESPTEANTKANAVSQAMPMINGGGRRPSLSKAGTATGRGLAAIPTSASWSAQDDPFSGSAPPPSLGVQRSTSTMTPNRLRRQLSRSNSSAQPLVSPVERRASMSSGGGQSVSGANLLQTPRAKSGLELQKSGSLWDRSTVSPIASSRQQQQEEASAAGYATPKTGFSTPKVSRPKAAAAAAAAAAAGQNGDRSGLPPTRRSSGGRDQFEDALLRALDDKWESARSLGGGGGGVTGAPRPPQRTLSRSNSSTDGVAVSPMLQAVKTWTCQCAFENSVGQTSCLGCGRVAPLSRPTTPARKRLPPHRRNSHITPTTEADL
eukprot:g9528.t1